MTAQRAVAPAPLDRRVARGALWAGGSTMLMRFMNIAVMAVVARLVAPAELGIFALALTVHAVVATFAELGVGSAVARKDLDPDRIAGTVTTLALLTSGALAAAMAIFAEPLAEAVGSAEAAGPLRVMAITVALIGPFAVPAAQLQRDFRQDRLFIATALSFIPSTAVLLLLASHGDGATAFAWSRVAGVLATGILVVAAVPKRYRPGFRRKELPGLVRFGLPLAAANLVSQVLLNVDYVFVGRQLPLHEVGLYMLAFNIAAWPTGVMGSILNSVVLPAFSDVRRDPALLADALSRGVRSVALLACPIGGLTLGLATPLLVTVYGSKWGEAAPVLSVLTVHGVVFVMCLLFANIVIAMGRTGVLLGVQLAAIVCLLPALAVGIELGGLVGVGVAHIVVICGITLPAYLVAIRRSTGVRLGVLVRAVVPPFAAAGAAAVVAFVVAAVPDDPLVRLLAGGVAGGGVYLVLAAPLLAGLAPGSAFAARIAPIVARLDRSTRWALGRS
jgi:PST family polysaccharide transporter